MDPTRRRLITGTLAAAGAAVARIAPAWSRARRGQPNPLFEDTFDRRDRHGWSREWFNQRYGRFWAIDGGRGIYRLPPTENRFTYRPNPVLVLDRDVADIDLRATVSMSNATGRVGFVARAIGYGDYYAAYLAPDDVMRISRCNHHSEVKLAKGRARHEANRRYRLRMQVRGSGPVRIRAKAWPHGTREPARWNVDFVDGSPATIVLPGAFGMFFEHATDRRGCTFRVMQFIARSKERGAVTPPALAYSLAGPLKDTSVRVVAKTSVPATLAFEVATDPAFTQIVQSTPAKRTSRSQTARATIDTSAFGSASFVYWRALAERNGATVTGPVHRFRTPAAATLPVRFAFGSCTKWQTSPRRSFDQARLKLPDFYLHQGDFGYVPTKVVAHAADTYQDHWVRMLMDPSFTSMVREVPFGWARDDADYGRNRADANTLRRFTIGAHDQLNANPGPYYTFRYGGVAVFSIDCRRYSTGKTVPVSQRSKLGPEQKRWLKDEMQLAANEDVGLLVLSSPQAFGSDASMESWRGGYREEWEELVEFFQALSAPVLIVSGDAHGHRLHEYPQKNLQTDVPRIVEIVSSGTEQNKFFDDVDPQFLLRRAKGSGFGLVELGAEQDLGGQRTRSLTLTAVKTADGSPFWTANYVIVKGLGILPVGI